MTTITKQMVYTIINESRPYTYNADTLASYLKIDTIEDRVALLQCLHDLTSEYRLFQSKKLKYATNQQRKVAIGTFTYKTDRYGFIDTEEGNHYYVRTSDIDGLFDQDQVVYRISNKVNREARIVAIKSHTINTVVGTIFVKIRNGRKTYIPLLKHYDLHFEVIDLDHCGLNQDTYVIFTITDYEPLTLKISSIIGPTHEPFMDYTAIAVDHGVFPTYPKDGEMEAMKMASMPIQLDTFRCDLRDLTTFTIDGDDAKDFDDALSLIRHDDGYTVVVSIADVSHYVRYGTPLDKAAYQRGTSIYLPGMVIPMLPETLSNGSCSLNPGEDRYAISVSMDYDNEGNKRDSTIQLSVIRSNHRLTYGQTNAFFDDPTSSTFPYDTIGDDLFTLLDLSKKIHKIRYATSGIEFDSKELQIRVDRQGNPIEITTRKDGAAEQLIEDFMIEANVTVAQYLLDHNIPGIYRIHEGIDSDRLIQFNDLAREIYIPLPSNLDLMDSFTVAQYLKSCKNEPSYPIINARLLRTMKKARYSEICTPHYGLGLTTYCHFTSPIRRYPDLFVHRMLHYYVFHDQTIDDQASSNMMDKALHLSDCEIRAVQIEREAIDLKCCAYMRQYVGTIMDAMVDSITNSGMFMTTSQHIDVFVPFELSPYYWSTYYPYVEAWSDYGPTIALMDHVKIRITSIDSMNHRVIATLEHGKTSASKTRKKSKSRKKVKSNGSAHRRKS